MAAMSTARMLGILFWKKALNDVTQFDENFKLFSPFEIICYVESKWQREWASDDSTGQLQMAPPVVWSSNDRPLLAALWFPSNEFDDLLNCSWMLSTLRQLTALVTFVNLVYQEDGDPSKSDVVEGDGALERVLLAGLAVGVVLVPVDARPVVQERVRQVTEGSGHGTFVADAALKLHGR